MAPVALSCLALLAATAGVGLSGCSDKLAARESITLATTTSMQDSGMLDQLLPRFREQMGIEVKVVAVGSGQALEIGRRGDADVLITHSPLAEQEFMDEGFGLKREPVMRNDFVVVGPPDDPAQIADFASVTDTFRTLAEKMERFVSRGDDSGTHQKELEIWKDADIEPAGPWYIEAGVGMAQALRMASEKQAYTLSDRGTFLAFQAELDLRIVGERDPRLQNVYSVIVVAPAKNPHVKTDAAQAFARFLTQPSTRQLISQFGAEKYGEPLFQSVE